MHGALCVCYSGQCLLSSLIGGRSANRGLCAQPCRLPYELVDDAGRVLGDAGSPPAFAQGPRRHQRAAATRASRVSTALKIEGRMKSAEYVALVTGVYRAALDRAVGSAGGVRGARRRAGRARRGVLARFTEAYLVGERGNDMMSYRRPNNRGVPVGRVARRSAGRGDARARRAGRRRGHDRVLDLARPVRAASRAA